MSEQKQDFYGKEVADAIKEAVETLKVPQEELDIEVLETGSTGIFGLIRKKARIRVKIQSNEEKQPETAPEPAAETASVAVSAPEGEDSPAAGESSAEGKEAEEVVQAEADEDDQEEILAQEQPESAEDEAEEVAEQEASAEAVATVKDELTQLLDKMGYSTGLEVESSGLSVQCSIDGEFQEQLSGPEGKTLDSIQYLLRKIVARKCTERLRITVNVGDFREQRLEELKVRAVELAAQVKEDGKTQVLPALNPSERREIHMVLQEDKEIRSRSVGDGLFKKILIFKPGKSTKGGGGGRRRSGPRGGGRRGRPPKNNKRNSNDE